MSESDKSGSRSEAISAKVEIEPREFRRILSHQYREEILGEVWARVRRVLTGGGFISASLIVGGIVFLRGEINSAADKAAQGAATTAVEQQIRQRDETLRSAARDAARAEIREQANDFERVRTTVRTQLEGLIDRAIREEPFRLRIVEMVRPQLAQILQDNEWRRPIERAVFQQQALDTSRPLGARLFGFAAIAQDGGGQAAALDILVQVARRIRGADESRDEIAFLRQAVETYATTFDGREQGQRSFRDHEAILDVLFEIEPAAGAQGSGFEVLMREFDDPLAIASLVRRIRQSAEDQRARATGVLVRHPGAEARERVDTLLCSGEAELSRLIIQAYRDRPAAMAGDESGLRFMRILNCSAGYVASDYLPAVDPRCLPGRDLLDLWRLSELPDRNLRPEARRRRSAQVASVASRLRNLPEACPAMLRDFAQGAPSFRHPLHWTMLRPAPDEAPSPLLFYASLLPAAAGADQPRWLPELLRPHGALAAALADPSRHLVHIAVLLERLAGAPAAWTDAEAARQRLVAALLGIAGPTATGSQAERLLIARMFGPGAEEVCAAALHAFGADPQAAIRALAAFAKSVRCAQRADAASEVAGLLEVMRSLPGLLANDRDGARRLLDAVAEARSGAGDSLEPAEEARVARRRAGLFAWLSGLSVEQAAEGLLAEVLGALFATADPLTFLRQLETGEEGLRAALRPLAARPAVWPQMQRVLPYLSAGFAAAVPAAPGRADLADGRSWSSLQVEAGQRILVPPGALHAVLVRIPEQAGGEALPDSHQLRPLAHGLESETLHPGRYFIGARMAGAAGSPQAMPGPLAAPEANSFERARIILETDRTWQAQVDRSGTGYFPFTLSRGRRYVVETFRLAQDLDTLVEVFGPDRRSLAEDDDSGGERFASRLCFAAEDDGTHWVTVRNYEGPPRAPLPFEFRVSSVPACP